MENLQAESDYYQNFDFSTAKRVSEVPALVNLRENYRTHLAKVQGVSSFEGNMSSNNLSEIFVQGVIERFLTTDIANYTEMLNDKNLDEANKKIILDYMKLAVFNCVSGFLGVIDGVSFVEGTDSGRKIMLSLDNIQIQGNLHDIFNEKIQNFEAELDQSNIWK